MMPPCHRAHSCRTAIPNCLATRNRRMTVERHAASRCAPRHCHSTARASQSFMQRPLAISGPLAETDGPSLRVSTVPSFGSTGVTT
ncbi:hypothetical protein BD414DRAFT_221767 [Trametes punicea]|nr:hypothetical protein BD414DRAFT_221767 [Trametes punicea]